MVVLGLEPAKNDFAAGIVFLLVLDLVQPSKFFSVTIILVLHYQLKLVNKNDVSTFLFTINDNGEPLLL